MHAHRRDEAGDSLLEIIIAIVLIGLSMSVLFYAFSTSTSGSTTHQDLVTANGILRAYAETTKAAVKNGCPGNPSVTVTYAPPDSRFVVSPASPFTVTCPPTTGSIASQVPTRQLSVTLPNSEGTKTLDIELRSS
jgi:hypothetical protein